MSPGFEGDYAGNFIYPTVRVGMMATTVVADSDRRHNESLRSSSGPRSARANWASELTYLGENIDAADI